jgi:hypothetical protein
MYFRGCAPFRTIRHFGDSKITTRGSGTPTHATSGSRGSGTPTYATSAVAVAHVALVPKKCYEQNFPVRLLDWVFRRRRCRH